MKFYNSISERYSEESRNSVNILNMMANNVF